MLVLFVLVSSSPNLVLGSQTIYRIVLWLRTVILIKTTALNEDCAAQLSDGAQNLMLCLIAGRECVEIDANVTANHVPPGRAANQPQPVHLKAPVDIRSAFPLEIVLVPTPASIVYISTSTKL